MTFPVHVEVTDWQREWSMVRGMSFEGIDRSIGERLRWQGVSPVALVMLGAEIDASVRGLSNLWEWEAWAGVTDGYAAGWRMWGEQIDKRRRKAKRGAP